MMILMTDVCSEKLLGLALNPSPELGYSVSTLKAQQASPIVMRLARSRAVDCSSIRLMSGDDATFIARAS